MRRAAKIGIVAAASVAGLLAAAAGTIYGLSAAKLRRTFALPQTTLSVDVTTADLARGEHLVHNVSMCVECHDEDLGGRVFMDAGPIGTAVGSNLTRGAGGVGATFTDEDWVLAIRHGLRRDGRSLLIMPSEAFAHYSDTDLAAIIAYLKTLPPVDRELQPTRLRVLGRALLAAGRLPLQVAERTPILTERTMPTPAPTAAYGAYLANISGCTGCHGADLAGGAGGPPGSPLPPNLTPAGNLVRWSEQDFVRALREGVRPDGTRMNDAMPWRFIGRMSDDELHALWLYLQSVPARQPATTQS